MSYEIELQMKHNQVKNVFKKIAHLDHVPVHEPISMAHPWHYRHKVQMPVGEKNGRLVTGFYQPRSHRIIETEKSCTIQESSINAIIEKVRDVTSDLGIQVYNDKTHQGILRHIVEIGRASCRERVKTSGGK